VRKHFWLLVILLAPAAAQAPEALTQQERNFAMSHLNATRKRFHDSITGLTEAQWTFKPGPDRWSIAECAEHIARSEDFLYGMLTEKIMKGPASPEKKAETKGNDELILKFVTDRSKKAQAPEPLRPTGQWASATESLAHFNESRDRTIAYVEKTPDDLRAHIIPSEPPLKSMDAYQWVLVISGHSARHTAQIEEVKADPKYPK
jgi:uncharacterized damage-inducible protein DinB